MGVPSKFTVMIVDDVKANIDILIETLRPDYEISVAMDGNAALEAIAGDKPDIILLDIMMPMMDGYETCKRLKADESTKNIPVIFITAMTEERDEAKGLALGAVDYIIKPFSPELVKSRIRNQLELKRYRDHLEELVAQRTRQLRENHIDTIYRLTLASEYKDEETGGHIKRISHYARELALRMGLGNEFADIMFHASPMHDIGKVSIPDAILLKQSPLNNEEWRIMQAHAAIGARILEGSDSPLLKIAADIALCHHERWDGTGYPQGLKREETTLAARITMLVDIYDALRSIRPYKPAFDHHKTCVIMAEGDGRTMPEHFDPLVLKTFKENAAVFKDIYSQYQ